MHTQLNNLLPFFFFFCYAIFCNCTVKLVARSEEQWFLQFEKNQWIIIMYVRAGSVDDAKKLTANLWVWLSWRDSFLRDAHREICAFNFNMLRNTFVTICVFYEKSKSIYKWKLVFFKNLLIIQLLWVAPLFRTRMLKISIFVTCWRTAPNSR